MKYWTDEEAQKMLVLSEVWGGVGGVGGRGVVDAENGEEKAPWLGVNLSDNIGESTSP